MNTLRKITIEEAKQIIPDKDKEVIKALNKDKLIFRVVSNIKPPTTDDLVNVEIALRQCERTGFFRK